MSRGREPLGRPPVLVVDDDPVIRLLVRAALEDAGLPVIEAENGERALQMFDKVRPCLVVLDVVMPGLDGFQVCERLRSTESGRDVPVLIVTGMNDVDSIERAYRAGATDFTAKPINPTVIPHRVHYMLRSADAQRRAESASRAKTVMLANVSHEVRTPLTAILGNLEILLDEGAIDASRSAQVETVRRNADRLMLLINQVLDLARMTEGTLELATSECAPREITEDVVSTFRLEAEEKGLELRLDVSADVPASVHADAERLRQVMLHLVSNAVKFTHEGRIVVGLDCVAGAAGDATLSICVCDTGIGIAESGRIFSPFEQEQMALDRDYGGVGLGLTLTRGIVDLLGGRLEVESTLGEGSTFYVLLPVRECRKVPAPSDARDVSIAGVHVLLVEDAPDNQRLIGRILERAGARVTLAENGQVAVEAVSALGDRDPLDLVLMDMQMPVLDGYEATRQLRRNGLDVPVVALTAHAGSGDRETCLAAGCDDYMTKPIRRAELVALVHHWLEKNKDGR